MTAILLGSCGPSASTNSTNTLHVIYTAAAQTVEAQYTADVPTTTEQTATPIPTDTPSDISVPTSLPVLEFAATSTPYPAIAGGTACDDSSYISDVTIPDNTVVPAGQTFVKTWMFQNTGSCAWNANYTLTFINGDPMNGADASIGGSVDPGQQAALSVTLTAPTTAGQYTGYWQLANDSGEAFGVTVYVLIDVAEDATATPISTDTPTVTATEVVPTATIEESPTPTETSQPSATPSPTAEMSTPTGTNTSIPTPTNTPSGPTATSVPTDTKAPTNTAVPTDTPLPAPTATP
ncbi:MAG: NBR1-Ig-like domain-containing protein [Chloroflexi bacterium]|nr:NBR1-Ig-like domain-containing protein [Chloroflexota bacterium]